MKCDKRMMRLYAVTDRAWVGRQTLSEQERFVLSRFYMDDESKQVDSVGEICERFHIERTSAYKRKDRALSRLTLLLYGK